MCGLVGIAGKIGLKEEKAFELLLMLDTIRGPHSTGVLLVNGSKACKVVKEIGTAWDFLASREYDVACAGYHNVLMGHNRWATRGKINARNAHPFEFPNIIGAHNGTLTTTYQLDDHYKFEVDSENIFHHMNKNGVEDTISKLHGAFALTWYNKEEQTINFIRNNQRSLYHTYSTDKKTVFWASEPWMLSVGLKRSDVEHGPVLEFKEGLHYKMPVELAKPYEAAPFKGIEVVPVELYVPKPAVVTSWGSVTGNGGSSALAEVKKPLPALFRDYAACLKTEMQFYADSESVAMPGKESFIQCYANEDNAISIRLYLARGSRLWNTVMHSTRYFTAYIKAYSAIEGGYLTVELSTLEEVPDPQDDTLEVLYKVYRGNEVSGAVFDIRAKRGCSWCSCVAEKEESEELLWLSDNDFVCGDCQELSDVKQHIGSIN